MANREQSQTISEQFLAFEEEPPMRIGESDVTAAGGVSAMLIYSAATFDQTMKPTRGVLLLSFAIFLPISLAYRRWIRQYVVTSSAGRSFLVIGGGARAARFFEAYKNSPNE